MSLATISELRGRGGVDSESSDADLAIALAAATSAIEGYCSTYFGRRITRTIPAASTTTFVVPGHSLVTGDTVRLSGMSDTDLNGSHVVTVVDNEEQAFSIATGSSNTGTAGLIRKQLTRVVPSSGGQRLWLNHRPISEIVQIRIADTPNVFDAVLAADEYMLDMDGDGEYSVSGTVIRLSYEWPYRITTTLNKRQTVRRGSVEVKFIPGMPVMPADIIDAAIQFATSLVERSGEAPAASEGLDYYSYSAMSGDVMATMPDSIVSAMNRWKRHPL